MKINKFIFGLLIIAILITSCNMDNDEYEAEIKNENKKVEKLDIDKSEDNIKKIISQMSHEEKISQLFILGFNDNKYSEELEDLIIDEKIGGLIFFDRNISSLEELKELNYKIDKTNKENNKIPMFISLDEESKTVSRLGKIYESLPSLLEIGNKNSFSISYDYGKLLGMRLINTGFNLNFSPVVDINSNPNNPVINVRSLGADAEVVSNNAIAIAKGQNSMRVISCIKHFPGHGDTNTDSHLEVPKIEKSIQDLLDLELIPFINCIQEEVDMIMISHIFLPKLDNKIASLSDVIMKEILTDQLGYKGVIISDDLTMNASNLSKKENAAYEFIIAGGDIALVSHDINIYYEAKKMLLEDIKNEEFEKEIDEKIYKILCLKDKYNLKDKKIDFYKDDYINQETERIKGGI
ncbi:MAG TPA: glycoside hydrolase family 3 N-terminal domain-containing protein [Tissierellaceae bacterium]